MDYALQELAVIVEGVVMGNPQTRIKRIMSILEAEPGDITFLSDKQYSAYLGSTSASAVLLHPSMLSSCSVNALLTEHPKSALVRLLDLFYPPKERLTGSIHSSAVVGKNCTIDSTVVVGPQVVIEDGVSIAADTVIDASTVIGEQAIIGAGCHLYPHVTIYPKTSIGARTRIHSGAVIGADGFGFHQRDDYSWQKVPQVGHVVIGDDVEIGANTTIDCGALSDTLIGNGVKIDNLVMVAHNVSIGDHTIIAGCVGIAGSVRVGRYCMIGGLAGINGHLSICDRAVITAMSGVNRSVTEPGVYSSGPCGVQPSRQWHKNFACIKQLNKFHQRLKHLEQTI